MITLILSVLLKGAGSFLLRAKDALATLTINLFTINKQYQYYQTGEPDVVSR